MDAKEYFKDYYGEKTPVMSGLDYEEMQSFAESYHQAKSKEEAVERYEIAMEYLRNRKSERPHPVVVERWLHIAAFGKEGEG